MASDPPRRVLSVLFFLSGFPALIYQLVWQRALFRILGVNIESVTIVVTAFMLGLGLGALGGGLMSKRRDVPLLLLLASIETLTAIYGFFSLGLFETAGQMVLGKPLAVTALVALALVVVPTLLMGATLPILVGHLANRTGNVGTSVGHLYYVNTLGAGASCLTCAVLLFPVLGMHRSVLVAVFLNIAVALGAVGAHMVERTYANGGSAAKTRVAPALPGMPGTPRELLPFHIVLVLSALSGAIALSYEIFFIRTISYANASRPLAFAATLGTFLVGLASGSRTGGEQCQNSNVIGLLRRLVRALISASLIGAAFLPLMTHTAWIGRASLGLAMLVVYLWARQWGEIMPLLAHVGVPSDGAVGNRTGKLYFANIVGSASGCIVTGFVLMNHLGLAQIGQLLLVAGFLGAVLLGSTVPAPPQKQIVLAAALIASAVVSAWLLPLGARGLLEALQWKQSATGARFAQVVENRSGIIAVDSSDTVYGNGAYDGHFNVDLVHDNNGIVRPFALSLFHSAPRDVLMIGLSSGSWAQVIANNPEVKTLTTVEINPGYARLIATHPNVATVLTNPKVTAISDDGRRWLRANSDRRFDAIMMNSTFHFRENASNLLSVEFLTILKQHLNPGGVVFYNTTDSARVQRTGCSTFAYGARFTNHILLSDSPIDWNFQRWRRILEAYEIDGHKVLNLSRPGDAAGVDRLMAMEPETHVEQAHQSADWIEPCPVVLARTAGLRLITDDNMGTEWSLSLAGL